MRRSMSVNRDKPDLWKRDIAQSVDMYNEWFLRFAPRAYRQKRAQTTEAVEALLAATANLTDLGAHLLRANPSLLPALRMSTCPPLASDRLIGLGAVSTNLIRSMERAHRLPPRMPPETVRRELDKIIAVIEKMIDPDVFVWLGRGDHPTQQEVRRSATIVADRLCGALASPIIRNAQEKRQLASISRWLTALDYEQVPAGAASAVPDFRRGTFAFRVNVPVRQEGATATVNVSVDAVVMPKAAKAGELPLLLEAKSAGDFTNVNKRRKEEAAKMNQLRATYGAVRYVLFLCGYFDSGYLGYEAAEGIDWVWEHRIDDLREFGL